MIIFFSQKKILEKGLYNVVRNDVIVETNTNTFNKFTICEYDPFFNNNLLHYNYKIDIYFNNYKFKIKKLKDNFNYLNKDNLNYNIECYKKDNYLVFYGYVYNPKLKKNNYNDISIILRGVNNCYEIKTKEIFDVYPSEKYHENLNFVNFYSNINITKLEEDYEVYIRIRNGITKVNEIYYMNETITRRYINE